MHSEQVYVREATLEDMSYVRSLHERAYAAAGYCPKCEYTCDVPRTSPGTHALVLVACEKRNDASERIVGTISCTFFHDPRATFLATDFLGSLKRLTRSTDQNALVWRLAIDTRYRRSPRVVLLLMDAVIQHATKAHVTTVLCAVHPKHESFYGNRLGFRAEDACTCLSGLTNAPAVLLAVPFIELKRRFGRLVGSRRVSPTSSHVEPYALAG